MRKKISFQPNAIVNYFRGSIYIVFGIVLLVLDESKINVQSEIRYVLSALCFSYGIFRIYRAYLDSKMKRTEGDDQLLDSNSTSQTDNTVDKP